MTSKIIRADGITELASIKSVTYHESVNADIDLRPGCVASNYIEVTCFGAQTDAPDVGEALTYYQVVGEEETLIGIFYAEPSIPTKNSYSFIAYDAVHKLDADFSAWLSANQDNFPYTVYQLVSQACTISGVTLGTSSWDHSTMSVNAFYADGLTCRNILQYAAEIACAFVRCNTSGQIVFDWYKGAASGETNTASGAIATFNDGADRVPLKKLVAQIAPVQDLHGYDSPWPAGGGKNKLPLIVSLTKSGVTVEATEDGKIWIHGTPTISSGHINFPNLATIPTSLDDNTVAVSTNEKTVGVGFVFGSANGSLNLTLSDTATTKTGIYTAGTHNFEINVRYDVGTINKKYKVQLELGSAATAWSPYENLCPISGWTGLEGQRTGANLLPMGIQSGSYANSVTITVNPDLSIIYNKPNSTGWTTNVIGTFGLQAGTYTVIEDSTDSSQNQRISFKKLPDNTEIINTRYIKRRVFTLTEYTQISADFARSAQATDVVIKFMIFKGDTATASDYEPYSGESLSVNWQDEAGTVYGGSMTVNEDGSGVLTATRELYNMRNHNKTYVSAYDYQGKHGVLINYALVKVATRDAGLCSVATVSTTPANDAPQYMWFGVASAAVFWIGILDALNLTIDEFKTWLGNNDVWICREKSTSVEYSFTNLEQLTTLLGTNNVWVDTGDVEVEYYPTLGRIYPSSGTDESGDRFAYKQDGLNYDNYDVTALARVAVHPVGEDEVAYYYPTGVTSGNTLDIMNNALLYGASAADMSGIAQTVYDGITAVGQYRPFNVSMFPNECPFRSGQIVPVTDAQGVSFTTAIMSKVVTDSAVTLASTGREVYGDYAFDTAKKLIQLAADIVQINKLKVDWAEIDQIFARDITVTGQLHSDDYEHTDGEVFANHGMGMDFGEKRFNTPNFGITPEGDMYAQGGMIAGFNIRKGEHENVTPSAPTYTNTGYTYSDGYLEVTQNGTASFNVPLSATVGGVSKPLTKIVYQCYYGHDPILTPTNFSYRIAYLNSSESSIYTQMETLPYASYENTDMRQIISSATYLPQCASLKFDVTLRADAACRVVFQYGNYYAIYTESDVLGDGASNVYVGDDGISVGENIKATPDGNAKIYTLVLGRPLAIEGGGTGQSDVMSYTTISSIITAGSGFTITNATYKQWGKVAQLYFQASKTEAQTTAASMTVGTVIAGKRPAVLVGAVCTDASITYAYVAAGGAVSARGTWAAGATKTFAATYILA